LAKGCVLRQRRPGKQPIGEIPAEGAEVAKINLSALAAVKIHYHELGRCQIFARTPLKMTEKVFTAKGLTKTYVSGEVEVHALRGVDLDVWAGEVVVLLGPSGSGKSTLLNIMGGLDQATTGSLFFKDIELNRLDDRALTAYRRQHVGFVFQFYNLVPSLTAYENVKLVTEIADRPMRPDEALALVGLADRQDHFPAELSGGEQQRVAIARAIAKRPEVLLCDEPTGALDSKTGIRVIDALLGVNSQLGTTTVIITHNASIREVADRVLSFADGQISGIHRNEKRRAAAEISW
jgi:putative ABC transport system ATP-binding protein